MLDQTMLDALLAVNEEEQEILDGRKGINRRLYMEGKTNVINSRLLLEKGRLITVRKHTRFIHFPEHTHDYVEVIYMVQGKTTHYINGQKVELEAGDLLFMSQNAVQEILPAGYDDLGVNFIILPEFFDTTLQMVAEEETPLHRFLVECMKGETSESSYLHFKVGDVIPIQNLLENMIWTLVHEPSGRQNINKITMGLLFLNLMNHTESLSYQNDEQKLKLQILNYVEDNYRSGSLEELSSLLHYDFSVLSREIKKMFGKNYTGLVQEKRIAQACFLLQNTSMSVADVSVRIGYENTSYFYRIFQKCTGLTPKEYRKKTASAVKDLKTAASVEM